MQKTAPPKAERCGREAQRNKTKLIVLWKAWPQSYNREQVHGEHRLTGKWLIATTGAKSLTVHCVTWKASWKYERLLTKF